MQTMLHTTSSTTRMRMECKEVRTTIKIITTSLSSITTIQMQAPIIIGSIQITSSPSMSIHNNNNNNNKCSMMVNNATSIEQVGLGVQMKVALSLQYLRTDKASTNLNHTAECLIKRMCFVTRMTSKGQRLSQGIMHQTSSSMGTIISTNTSSTWDKAKTTMVKTRISKQLLHSLKTTLSSSIRKQMIRTRLKTSKIKSDQLINKYPCLHERKCKYLSIIYALQSELIHVK